MRTPHQRLLPAPTSDAATIDIHKLYSAVLLQMLLCFKQLKVP
jgi:hypothetical protein